MDKSSDSELLKQIAISLYAEDWQERLTDVLMRWPEKLGDRVSMDLVGAWASGKKRPPLWVMSALSSRLILAIDDADPGQEPDLRELFAGLKAAINHAVETGCDGTEGVKITVVGPDPVVFTEMINNRPKEPIILAPGIEIMWRVPLTKSEGLDVIEVVLSFVGTTIVPGVVSGLIVDWIISRFRGRAERLIINSKECEFDRGELVKTIEQTITYERK